jgi:hypothetical protein
MSSPSEDNQESRLPSEFICCVEKLLSSVSTLNKHLSILTQHNTAGDTSNNIDEKLQVRLNTVRSVYLEIREIEMSPS